MKTSEIFSGKLNALKEETSESDDESSEESWKPSSSGNESSDESCKPLDKVTSEGDMSKGAMSKEDTSNKLGEFELSGTSKKRKRVQSDSRGKKKSKSPEQPKETSKVLKSSESQRTSKKGNNKPDKNQASPKPRRKVSCPLIACKAQVTHLPRHMRNVHKWTKEAAAKILLKYNIRKRKSQKKQTESSKKKVKDYHCRRRCPISNCHSIVFRLSGHLKKVHKLSKSSKAYSDALASAFVVPDKKHPLLRWKEERNRHTTCLLQGAEGSESVTTSDDNIGSLPGEKEDGVFKTFDGEDGVKIVSDRHPVLKKFEEWLQSPDGGKRDLKTVKQHSAQLLNLLKAIDDSCDLSSLLDTRLIRHLFLKSYVEKKNYEAATIKSYLMSLRHYFSFLLSDRPDEVEFNVDDVTAAREKVKMWSTSYKRESCTRRWKKLEEDTGNFLTPANIQAFEKSEAAREAVKLLGQYSDPMETVAVTQAAYTLVRDFLFTQIFIDNANRPGVLSYMTMEEFSKMRREGDDRVIAVMKHKTVHIHGPAYIVLSAKLKAWLSIFVEVLRAQITSSTSGPVFLTWNAQCMTSGQINKAIQSVFKKAGITAKITSTLFRKAAVTKVHESNPEMSGKLAGLMAHNEATAKKYYLLSEKTKASVEASKALGQLMRKQNVESKSGSNGSGAKEVCNTKKRMPWTQEDLKKVEENFSEELKQNTVTLEIVRTKIQENEVLNGMSPRRVYDRLKKLSKHGRKVETDGECSLPNVCESLEDKLRRMVSGPNEETTSGMCDEESSAGILPPTERSSNVVSEEAVSTIRKVFVDMIKNKPISKVEIKTRCHESKEGKKLLAQLSVDQLVNRIKYERKKTRSEDQ